MKYVQSMFQNIKLNLQMSNYLSLDKEKTLIMLSHAKKCSHWLANNADIWITDTLIT